jgi:hypothetical protein
VAHDHPDLIYSVNCPFKPILNPAPATPCPALGRPSGHMAISELGPFLLRQAAKPRQALPFLAGCVALALAAAAGRRPAPERTGPTAAGERGERGR